MVRARRSSRVAGAPAPPAAVTGGGERRQSRFPRRAFAMSSNAMPAAGGSDHRGLAAAIAAYALWGVFPLYWHLLKAVPALQIIAHRVIWCGVFVVGYLLIREGGGWLRRALAGPKVGRMLLVSSLLISCNWGIYIWAVTNGRVVDASLGYFINPLVNVVLGVMVLRERLNVAQWSAVAIAAAGVAWLWAASGAPPWIALALAGSFAVYGLIRKTAAVDAVPGLAIESLFLLVPALAWLAWATAQGEGRFLDGDPASDASQSSSEPSLTPSNRKVDR
jgi:chloramphenicol-sensitive protein RarD